jgi:hypothetical protein
MVMLQTPLNKEDASTKALKDEEWTSFVFGCFDEAGRSRWPQRWTTEELKAQKKAAVSRNKTSVCLRQKECKLTSPETAMFLPNWWVTYDEEPEKGITCIWIDPVPPPSEAAIASGMPRHDNEAFAVVTKQGSKYYVRTVVSNKGHDPNWTIATFFTLLTKYRPRFVCVESVAYQRTLAWLLKQAMRARRQYAVIEEVTDKRSKHDRISDCMSGPASLGDVLFNKTLQGTQLQEQFVEYPDVTHEDELEAVACAVGRLTMTLAPSDSEGASSDNDDPYLDESEIPELGEWRGAPGI